MWITIKGFTMQAIASTHWNLREERIMARYFASGNPELYDSFFENAKVRFRQLLDWTIPSDNINLRSKSAGIEFRGVPTGNPPLFAFNALTLMQYLL